MLECALLPPAFTPTRTLWSHAGQEQSEKNTLLNPVLIVEVLSEGTESYDRGQKFEPYRQIESFREYLVIAQDRVYVEHHRRDESIHTQWTMRVFTDSEDVIPVSAVPAQLRIADIYRKVPVRA